MQAQSFAAWWATEGSLGPTALSAWTEPHWQLLLGQSVLFRQPQTSWYAQALTNSLAQVLWQEPNYYFACHLSDAALRAQVQDYTLDPGLAKIKWRQLHLDLALTAVRRPGLPLVVVGPPELRRWQPLVNYQAFIDVPPRHAYWCLDDLAAWTLAAVEDLPRGRAVVWLVAELIAPLLLDMLWQRLAQRAWVIDATPWWQNKQLLYSVADP